MVVNLPLGQKLIIGSTFENGFEATLTLKSNVLRAEGGGGGGWKWYFYFFTNVWVAKLKPFSGKARQNIQSYVEPKLVIASTLENSFEATLRAKTNVLSIWKQHFSLLYKFVSCKVETVLWKSEAILCKFLMFSCLWSEIFEKWFSILMSFS